MLLLYGGDGGGTSITPELVTFFTLSLTSMAGTAYWSSKKLTMEKSPSSSTKPDQKPAHTKRKPPNQRLGGQTKATKPNQIKPTPPKQIKQLKET